MGLGRLYGSRPALSLWFSALPCAGTAPGGLGMVPVVDGAPRREQPRLRAERLGGAGTGTLAFTAGTERRRGFRYLPPSMGKLSRAVLSTGLQCSEKGSGRPRPCKSSRRGAGARTGQSPARRAPDVKLSFPHSFSPTYVRGSNLTYSSPTRGAGCDKVGDKPRLPGRGLLPHEGARGAGGYPRSPSAAGGKPQPSP